MPTTLDDLIAKRPSDAVNVDTLPEILRTIIDYISDTTSASSGATVQSPVGMKVDYFGGTIPTGWLLCDGSSLSNVNYPELYAAIGIKFGGTGPTNFYLPDCRRRVMLGSGGTKLWQATGGSESSSSEVGTSLGDKGGEEVTTIYKGNLPNVGVAGGVQVDSENSTPFGSSTTQVNAVAKGVGKTLPMPLTAPLGDGVTKTNMPPCFVVTMIIKAKP